MSAELDDLKMNATRYPTLFVISSAPALYLYETDFLNIGNASRKGTEAQVVLCTAAPLRELLFIFRMGPAHQCLSKIWIGFTTHYYF
jgi:hypothetical protein